MRAKQGGSFATLLLSVPLSAIPLMAIFGIPNFARTSASTDEIIPDIVRQPSASFGDEVGDAADAPQGFRSRAADLLTSAPAEDRRAQVNAEAPLWGDETMPVASVAETPEPTGPEETSAEHHHPSPRPMQTAAVQPSATNVDVPPPTATATTSSLTWREASRRLEEIGIRDYALERSGSADRFLFVCRFSPGGDGRIIRRFEAEAAEPLNAVEDVLAQVDRWLQHRHAQNRHWLP